MGRRYDVVVGVLWMLACYGLAARVVLSAKHRIAYYGLCAGLVVLAAVPVGGGQVLTIANILTTPTRARDYEFPRNRAALPAASVP